MKVSMTLREWLERSRTYRAKTVHGAGSNLAYFCIRRYRNLELSYRLKLRLVGRSHK